MRARAERTDPSDAEDPTENADPKEPIEPMDSAEPTEPIDRNEPLEPIDRNEFSDQSERVPTRYVVERAALCSDYAFREGRPAAGSVHLRGVEIVQALSIVAAVAVAVQAGALIALHLLPTGYDPRHDAVSDYGIGRYRGWFWAQAVAGGVAGLALAIALAETTPSIPTLVVVMLLISVVARFLIPLFPTDQHGSRFQTLPGTIHMILAIVIFAALIVASSEFGSAVEHEAAWQGVKGWLGALPWVMTGAAVGNIVALRAPLLKQRFGLIERLFYVSSIAWFLIVSIELARIAG
jgi:hypothetical protein